MPGADDNRTRSVTLPVTMWDRIRKDSQDQERSQNQVIRLILRGYYAHRDMERGGQQEK